VVDQAAYSLAHIRYSHTISYIVSYWTELEIYDLNQFNRKIDCNRFWEWIKSNSCRVRFVWPSAKLV